MKIVNAVKIYNHEITTAHFRPNRSNALQLWQHKEKPNDE